MWCGLELYNQFNLIERPDERCARFFYGIFSTALIGRKKNQHGENAFCDINVTYKTATTTTILKKQNKKKANNNNNQRNYNKIWPQ